MNRKMAALALVSVLLMASFCFLLLGRHFHMVSAQEPWVTIPNQDHMIVESITDPETVDPAWAYDTASEELIFNVYEPLIQFDFESVQNFVPCLATAWTVSPDGLTYTFEIRQGVQFHDGSIMTTEDVEYSFEHILVQDRSGGPAWMFYEPLFGRYHADMAWPEDDTCPINLAVESNATHVWFNLASIYPPFMQILSQTWASILNKDFCIANGDWPGTFSNWKDYHNPTTPPLDVAGNAMSGTGPYKLDYWTHGVEWSVIRHEDYWHGWPAPSCVRSLDRATVKVVYEWGTRLADFRTGTADMVYVPRAFISQVEGWPGIRGIKDLPALSVDAAFFNFDIAMPSPYVGSGLLDGSGIPPDFFSDEHVRFAFAHAFNHTKYIEDAFLNEAQTPPSPHIRGLAYSSAVWDGTTNPIYGYLPPVPYRDIDLAKVEEEMKLAFGGTLESPGPVWTNGFEMTITYIAGDVPSQTAALTFSENMAAVNPDFVISTTAVTWSTYQGELWYAPGGYRSLMPLFIIGKSADYPDSHNFVQPFQHSQGYFAYPSSYSNATVDAWIEAGIGESDPDEREKIYHDIAWSYYYDQPSIALHQPLGRHWERDWVQGWYYNIVHPGYYFYHLWKGLTCDLNGDNIVGLGDEVILGWHWSSPPGPLGYDRIADIYPYLQYMGDLSPSAWLPQDPPGVPLPSIGEVDVFDLAAIHACWTEDPPPALPGSTTLSVVPFETVQASGTFYIDVAVDDVANMLGYQFKVFYDTNVLTATDFGSWAPFTDPKGLGGEINDAAGYVLLSYGYPMGEPSGLTTSDPMSIAWIEFTVDGSGACLLEIENSVIVDVFGDSIGHVTMGGEFRTAAGLPMAKFTWAPETPFIGEDVIFTSESTDPDGTIVSWDWDFGDGNTGTGEVATTAYLTPGDYTVTLTVTDDNANTDSHSDTITILDRTRPTVSVEPQSTVGPPPRIGEAFTVDINVSDVEDLYTWQAGLTFNATVLECLSIYEGEFLKRAGVTTLWTPGSIDNTIGEIGYSACSLTGATPGVSGAGQLMNVTFKVKNFGNSKLNLTDILLLDSNLASIVPVYTVDGYVQINPPDVAVLSVETSATEAYPTWTVPLNITVVVENQGTDTETFNVTAYANLTEIETKTVTLAAGASTTLVFNWNVNGIDEGTYTIHAEAEELAGEIDTADNVLFDGTVELKSPGDANGDGILNAYDAGLLGKAWGTTVGDPLYDPQVDFNGDGVIDNLDHEILKDNWP